MNNYYKPTIMANLMLFGVAPPLARMIGFAVTGGVTILIWACFRRGLGDLSLAALQAGTCLAVPYTFLYDLPMLANAVLLVWRGRADRPLGLIGIGILAATLLFPAVVALTTRFFYVSSLALLLFFALILQRIFAPAPRVAMAQG